MVKLSEDCLERGALQELGNLTLKPSRHPQCLWQIPAGPVSRALPQDCTQLLPQVGLQPGTTWHLHHHRLLLLLSQSPPPAGHSSETHAAACKGLPRALANPEQALACRLQLARHGACKLTARALAAHPGHEARNDRGLGDPDRVQTAREQDPLRLVWAIWARKLSPEQVQQGHLSLIHI